MYISVYVYTLNGAAALTGVENGAVNNIRGRVRQIRIGANVCRVVATEL